MRYLNKIIFINSAQIKYAEINLNGNIHFIGTQGVGKSTLLRAILFFYNADTQWLGISKQKSTYVDYYFNNSNSYIIYEVVREYGKFCIISYKSQHKVCFRFFEGEFNQSYFINENGNVPDNWDSIAQQLDKNNIFYTKRKIDEYREYRDIIYGNHDNMKNELKKYSILESKDYQQVPKTIQNVFLNSKMEAEFIKQIIISSLDNDIRIDLTQYAHHLNDFEMQLMDINNFKKHSTMLLADDISKLHIEINHFEQEKIQFTRELAYAVNENERRLPKLTEKLKIQQEQEITLNTKLDNIRDILNEKQKEINGDIRIQDENLKTAKKYREDYEKKNINEIIAEVEKKDDLEKKSKHLRTEKEMLSVQFVNIEMKYNVLFDTLENQYRDFLNGKNAQKNEINDGFLTFKDRIIKEFNEQISFIREEYKIKVNSLRTDLENNTQMVNDLKIKREQIKHTRFFEEELTNLEKEIQVLNNSIKQLPAEEENLSKEIEIIQKQWKLEEEKLQEDFERNKNSSETKIVEAKKQITEIEMRINNSKNFLYGWLTENYPNWENTIGKVIDDKVLFNSSLSPHFIEKSNNFYGIEINLNEIDKTVKTISDYEAEKSEINEQILLFEQSISDLEIKLKEDKENLKNKYSPKIREKNKILDEKEYHLKYSETQLVNKKVELESLKNKANIERQNQLNEIEIEIEKATKNVENLNLKIKKIEEVQDEATSAKEKEREKIIEKEKEKIDALLNGIEQAIRIKNIEIEHQRDDIHKRRNKELSESGADTERLNKIESELQILKQKLKYIDDNRKIVTEYEKDKREFIDRISEFEQEKQKYEDQLKFEKSKYNEQTTKLNKELEKIKNTIAELNNQKTTISEDAEKFVEFKKDVKLFESIEMYFLDSAKHHKTEKRAIFLINEIETIHYKKLPDKIRDLRIKSNEFLSKFSENNILGFRKQLIDEENALAFANELFDFMGERKIEQIEKEVNERFASVVSTIGTETGNLMAESKKIQSIINKINKDFEEKNFVGVIKRIELKIEDSENEIMQLLIMIKQYNDDNFMELGSANLFTPDNNDKKNKKAVDLLKQFVKKINESKKDDISLSDSFELKFRIEENQNDTGWVEKLSNVGSEGTDTLVKAMVNIMLLNVFKENVSKKFKDFKLHCMMDEIGKLHPNNVRGILKFANERNIWLINGSPIENDALAFNYIYKLRKDENSITKVNRIIWQESEV